MNHVTNHSPERKLFKRVFAISMVITTVMAYCYCGVAIDETSGDEVEQHDAQVQSNGPIAGVTLEIHEELEEVTIWRPLRVMAASPNPIDVEVGVLEQEEVESEPVTEEHDVIIEEEETGATEIERANTLYYVNDNGWKSYLADEYQDYLYEMCIKYDVEEYYTLFIAQMYHESGFETDVVSATNDYGLMQINVCNHDNLENKFGFTDFLDPYVSIESGVYFMSTFLHKYNDVEKALVCYNRGESAVINGTYSTDYSKGVLYDMTLLVEKGETP